MVITKISDGFGNQLFMYACGYAVSRRLNTSLFLDASILDNHVTRKLELENLHLKYEKLISYKKFKCRSLISLARKVKDLVVGIKCPKFIERTPWIYDNEILNVKNNIYLCGYWQSEKYFKEYRDELIQMIQPRYEFNSEVQQYLNEIEKSESLSIHIRRGDYVKNGTCIPDNYYGSALKIIEGINQNTCVFVFSDDIVFAKQMLAKYRTKNVCFVQYSSDNTTLDDFFLMSRCKYNIIANSSFSWWSAWINQNPEKVVIAPEIGEWRGDFYPEEWIKIEL